MTITKISVDAFGNSIPGVQVQMSVEEAKAIIAMISQGFLNPPMNGINVDYKAKDIGAKLSSGLKEVTR
jgi:hypothetical protein